MPLDQMPCITMYENNAQSRLFLRIAKRSIIVGETRYAMYDETYASPVQ